MSTGIPFFRKIQTEFDLNGPTLSMQRQPVGTSCSVASGIATFIGIGTAIYPPGQGGRDTNTGSITHQWHKVGVGALTDGVNVTGSGTTTLTLSGLTSPSDNGSEYFCQIGYTPNALSPNAINEPFDSASAKVTVSPVISLTRQPSNSTVSLGNTTTFSVTANTSDNSNQNLSYQWVLDGKNLSDGTSTSVPTDQAEFTSPGSFSWTAPADVTSVSVVAVGGGGGGQLSQFYAAGGGGGLGWKNNIPVIPGQSYTVVVGAGGAGTQGGGTDGGDSYFINTSTVKGGGGLGNNGGGGSYTGDGGGYGGDHTVYGGGGGAGGYSADGNSESGGAGGKGAANGLTGGGAGGGGVGIRGEGESGTNCGGDCNNINYGATMVGGEGGSGGEDGTSGIVPTFNNGYSGLVAGGPGGNYGGGGGGGADAQYGTILSGEGGGGAVRIIWGVGRAFPSTLTADQTPSAGDPGLVSGSQTPILTVSRVTPGFYKVFCKVSHTTANPGIVTTTKANLDVSFKRSFIKYERFGGGTEIAEQGSRDIGKTGGLSFRANAEINSRIICVYAPEEDVDVKITLGGAAGSANNGNRGGTGGISVFKTTLKKGDEYIIKLGVNFNQGGGPRGGINGGGGIGAIYHKAKLIAVAGGGGGAGTNGRGGDGGGLQVAGENGQGFSAGNGGVTIEQGTLSTYGMTQAGRTGVSDFDNDSSGSGRISGCTIGNYWREQGKSPCEDVGFSQFRLANGFINKETFTIERGYKSGQGHRNNGGAGSGSQGGGGAGARGGTGATNNGAGGGGASGYASDEVELLPSSVLPTGTILGGNDDVAFICIETYRDFEDHVPCIPPNSSQQGTERNVAWNVSRNASDENTVTFTKISGQGPDRITFGPNGGQYNAQIVQGAVYERTSFTASGGRGLSFRLLSGLLQIDDNLDNDFNDLVITPGDGTFTSDSRWEANW